MIRRHKIPDDIGNGSYAIFETPDFEFVDPTKHYAESYIVTNVSMMRDVLLLKNPPVPLDFIEKYIHKEAIKDWFKKLKEIEETAIPENLIALLKVDSKGEQLKLLKKISLSPDQFIAFIFKAWTDHGFSFSQYKSERQHAGLDKTQMPKLVEIKDGKVNKVGKTSLTDGLSAAPNFVSLKIELSLYL